MKEGGWVGVLKRTAPIGKQIRSLYQPQGDSIASPVVAGHLRNLHAGASGVAIAGVLEVGVLARLTPQY